MDKNIDGTLRQPAAKSELLILVEEETFQILLVYNRGTPGRDNDEI